MGRDATRSGELAAVGLAGGVMLDEEGKREGGFPEIIGADHRHAPASLGAIGRDKAARRGAARIHASPAHGPRLSGDVAGLQRIAYPAATVSDEALERWRGAFWVSDGQQLDVALIQDDDTVARPQMRMLPATCDVKAHAREGFLQRVEVISGEDDVINTDGHGDAPPTEKALAGHPAA